MGALIFESRVVERAVAALTSEQHAAAVRRGRAMSLDDAVNYVIETFEDVIGEPARVGAASRSCRMHSQTHPLVGRVRLQRL